MSDDGRVITAKLPATLASELDDVAERMERSKSWIMREAISQWLAEEQRRYELTLEAMADVDAGRTIPHQEVLAMVERRKRERRETHTKSAA